MKLNLVKSVMCLFLCSVFSACAQTNREAAAQKDNVKPQEDYKTAYFASGCFWCSESIFETVIGVVRVVPGYAGGTGKNPNYNNYEEKGHAESVKVIYNPQVINFATLLTVYFDSQNPFQINGQGPDIGQGYRSIVFYKSLDEKELIEDKISQLEAEYHRKIAAEVKPMQKFWEAEDYHQSFEQSHPNNPYILNVSKPRLNRFKQKHPELIKKD